MKDINPMGLEHSRTCCEKRMIALDYAAEAWLKLLYGEVAK